MKNAEKYQGMTVNERLYVSGMLNEFDKAMKEKDAAKVRSILLQLAVDEASIQSIIVSLSVLGQE